MQSSVRAVEAYRRCRLIDVVTSDEDKVAPVYRFEEICQLLRSSPSDVAREMLEHTMKRLDHKSPIVKQKTLRFMKYAATKSGPDFKRELQRQAGVIRTLFHYKGQLDALKGDALNKAVRDTAHETIAAIFGSEDKTVATMEDVGRRIQGFGSSHYEKPREDEKKTVFSGLVSQSIKQSVDMFNTYNQYSGSGSGVNKNSSTGTYRSQGLRRSLTAERAAFDKEEVESWNVRDAEANEGRSGPYPKISPRFKAEVSNGKDVHLDGRAGPHTVEDRLLDSLTTPGGVRLQPTRETLQSFSTTAQRLDAANLVNAIETKLKAHNWQVRFKALCLLETLIRDREVKVFDSVTAMFEEDANAVADCLSSPQTSLRDKAKKVLDILGASGKDVHVEEGSDSDKSSVLKPAVADLPDLLDTRDLDFNFDGDSSQSTPVALSTEQRATAPTVVAPAAESDLFGDWVDEPPANTPVQTPVKDTESDPFAGMSFHSAEDPVGNGSEPDLFSGLDVDTNKRVGNGAVDGSGRNYGGSLYGLSVSQVDKPAVPKDDVVDLFASLSTGNGAPAGTQSVLEQLQDLSSTDHLRRQPMQGVPTSNFRGDMHSANFFPAQRQGSGGLGGVFPGTAVPPQMFVYPPGAQYGNGFQGGMPGQFPANVMMQQPYAGTMNFAGMNGPQQQFAGNFPGVARYGSQNFQIPAGNGGGMNQSYPGDNFDFSSDPGARYGVSMEPTKKEDTRAFDFISDHVSQLGPKRNR